MLDKNEKIRYHKHLQLPEIGLQGQLKLKKARVLVVGAGGLGAPVLQYLVAAGVGNITIVDDDTIELGNLQRQILYNTEDVGKAKTEKAQQKLLLQNPNCKISVLNTKINAQNAFEIIKNFQVVVDCTDNLEARYAINDASVKSYVPMVYASVYKFEGQVSVFNYRGGVSFRDLYPETTGKKVASPAQVGLMGVLPGIVGGFQANEVIKIISGIGVILSGKLFVINLLNMSSYSLRISASQ